MCTFQTNNRTFQIMIRTIAQCSLDGCSGVFKTCPDKICNFISLYRSPSQSKDEFESFADNLKLNLDSITLRNQYLIVVYGDFNAQTKGW